MLSGLTIRGFKKQDFSFIPIVYKFCKSQVLISVEQHFKEFTEVSISGFRAR